MSNKTKWSYFLGHPVQ